MYDEDIHSETVFNFKKEGINQSQTRLLKRANDFQTIDLHGLTQNEARQILSTIFAQPHKQMCDSELRDRMRSAREQCESRALARVCAWSQPARQDGTVTACTITSVIYCCSLSNFPPPCDVLCCPHSISYRTPWPRRPLFALAPVARLLPGHSGLNKTPKYWLRQ